MDNPNSGRTKKGSQTKERIFQAALQLIQNKGYEQTTLVDICAEANIANGTFYHYFNSKQDILVSFVEQESRDLADFYANLEKTSYADALIKIIDYQADYYMRKGTEFVSTFYTIMLQTKHKIYDYGTFSLLEIIYDCFTGGQQAGEFSRHYSAHYLKELAVGLLYYTTSAWCIAEGELPLKEALHQQYQDLINLVRTPQS